MWKTLAPLVSGLSLLLALPAPAGAKREFVTCAPDDSQPQVVQLTGMLRHHQSIAESKPPKTVDHWRLTADGKTYSLYLTRKELLERVEILVNRPVVVTGILNPAGTDLWVTGLWADEFVKETIHVEVRGRLVSIRDFPYYRLMDVPADVPWREVPPKESAHDDVWERPRPPLEDGPIVGWRIVLGEKSYKLDFGNCDDERTGELLGLAKKLDGKGVVVTGTRVGDVIHVTGMKADEGAYRETVTVKIQGVLHETHTAYHHKSDRLFTWTVTAGGKTYRLEFPPNDSELHIPFQLGAERLAGKTVVVTGTLRDGVVTVDGLWAADTGR